MKKTIKDLEKEIEEGFKEKAERRPERLEKERIEEELRKYQLNCAFYDRRMC